jgi:predicted  nucleic acid-binding Zn-ribbon protein
MSNDEITALNDHMVHALGRINHLELQVKALAAAVAKLQAQVAQAQQRSQRFADGSQLIESPQGFTIIDEPAPYNRENKGDLGQK